MAQKKLENYRCFRLKCRAIEIAECDATWHPLPPEPSVYYFYNPFGAGVMRQARDRIRQSIEARPRQICVVYYNSVHQDVSDEGGWLKLVSESDVCCVYMTLPIG